MAEATVQVDPGDLDDVASRLFFIVGTSRSGTTLLQALLNAHSDVLIPPETHFFKYEDELSARWYQWMKAAPLRAFVDYLFEEKRRMEDLGIDREELVRAIKKAGVESKTELFLLVMALYGAKKGGATVLGEKTPRHLLYVDELADRYPDARFLVLFRDPRAKALSERHVPFGSPSLFVSAWRWRSYVQEHFALEQKLSSDRYFQTTYETLVRDPEAEIRKITSFLGIEFEDQMLTFYNREEEEKGYPEREQWKENTMKPIQKDRIDRWKEELSRPEIKLVEATAGPYLAEMGYSAYAASPLSRFELARTWVWDYFKAVRKDVVQFLGIDRSG